MLLAVVTTGHFSDAFSLGKTGLESSHVMSPQTGTLPRQGTQTSSSHQLQTSGVMHSAAIYGMAAQGFVEFKLEYFSLWPQF